MAVASKESQYLEKSPLVPLGWDAHQSLAHKFLGNVSIVLRTGCRVSHLAVIPPPGIILFLLVYFFGPFSVPDEGVALVSRGASKLEDALTEVSRDTVKGSRSVGVFGVSSNLGPSDLITGGSIGALEGGVTGVVHQEMIARLKLLNVTGFGNQVQSRH